MSGRRSERPRRWLLQRPDGTAEEFDVAADAPLPTLRPGEVLHKVDLFGSLMGYHMTYEDQQQSNPEDADDFSPSRFEPQHRCRYCKDTRHWPSQEDRCPWCTGTLSLVYSYKHPNGAVYSDQIAWTPGDHIPDSVRGFTVMDPKTGGPSGHLTADDLRQMSATAAELYPNPETTEGDSMDNSRATGPQPASPTLVRPPSIPGWAAPSADRIGSANGGAIENLNDYRRFVETVASRALDESEDALAGSNRYRDLSVSVSDGMGRLAALNVDRQTLTEGHAVAEQAVVVRDLARQLAAAVQQLHETAKAAATGARRHTTAQEVYDAGHLAERVAYDGH